MRAWLGIADSGAVSTGSIVTRREAVFWITAYAMIGIAIVARALGYALDFNGSPGDGPLQLFNALRRIENGQRMGGTFQYFHGAGFPYLHVPIYWVLGGGIFASEASRQILASAASLLVIPILARGWARGWVEALALATIMHVAYIAVGLDQLVLADNGSMGLRGAVPLVIATHLARRQSRFADLERGALLCLAILLGVEHGIAATAACVGIAVARALRSRNYAPIVGVSVTIGTAALTYASVLLIIAGAQGALSVVEYHFRLIPLDQAWYFGAPPSPYLSTWSQLIELLARPYWVLLALAAVASGVWSLLRTTGEVRYAEAFLGIYAMATFASLLGRFDAGYLQPAARIGLFFLVVRVYWFAVPRGHAPRRRIMLVAAAAVLALMAHPNVVRAYAGAPVHFARSLLRGPQLSPNWHETLAAAHRARTAAAGVKTGAALWSTYAGLVEADAGVFAPSFDYIIHPLGPHYRRQYMEVFRAVRPAVVQTIRPEFLPFEEWIVGNHWELYSSLLAQYRVIGTGPWSFFWMRATDATSKDAALMSRRRIDADARSLHLEGLPSELLEIRVFYRADGARPVIRIRDGTTTRAIVLAPYERERRFPLRPSAAPREVSWGGESVQSRGAVFVDSIQVWSVPVHPGAGPWLEAFMKSAPH
jgi:hypothetical protein